MTVSTVRAAESEEDGLLRLEVTFQDLRHTEWALWRFGTDAEVLSPASRRTVLRDRAAALAAHTRPRRPLLRRNNGRPVAEYYGVIIPGPASRDGYWGSAAEVTSALIRFDSAIL